MSLLDRQLKEEPKIKEIQTLIYQTYKISNCALHYLPNEFTCLVRACPSYCHLLCKECHKSHALMSIHKIVPKLAQAVREEWHKIIADHKKIEQQWGHCLVNINYCLDILNEVKKQIQERSKKVELIAFNQIMNQTYSMLKHDSNNMSPEMMLKNFRKMNDKYFLFQSEDKQNHYQVFQEERKSKRSQVKQASHKTKVFSESALAFSQDLAKIIEEKLRYEKRVSRLKEISNLRIFTLKDLHKQALNLEEVNDLILEFPKEQHSNKEQQDMPIMLQKCQNLKSLRINNKNGKLDKTKWRPITSTLQSLKFLKQLILNIRGSDLKILTELFIEKNKAVRQIQRLTLQICDEKELSVEDVYKFVNTMELRSLHLTLSRDNLIKQQMIDLLKGLRMGTSMSELPLAEMVINLNKNKVTDGKDIQQVSHLFNNRAQKIKQRSIVI